MLFQTLWKYLTIKQFIVIAGYQASKKYNKSRP